MWYSIYVGAGAHAPRSYYLLLLGVYFVLIYVG
jgi:hypothetical protein